MKHTGWQQLKANEKKGVSMAVVLCVSAFFIAFAAAILYTAGLMTAQSNMRLKEERCYQLAKSYAKVLNEELTSENPSTNASTFYRFANSFLENAQYAVYNDETAASAEATKYKFVADGTDLENLSKETMGKGYGNIIISLAKEQVGSPAGDLKNGEIEASTASDYTAKIEELQNTVVRQYVLRVEVTAYYEDASYTYSTEYTREEKYDVVFTYDDKPIMWVIDSNGSGNWRVGSTAGTIVDIPAGGKIQYTYQTGIPLSRKFIEDTGAITTTGGDDNAQN